MKTGFLPVCSFSIVLLLLFFSGCYSSIAVKLNYAANTPPYIEQNQASTDSISKNDNAKPNTGSYPSDSTAKGENITFKPEIAPFDSLVKIGEVETNGSFFSESLVSYGGWLFAAEGSGRIYAFDESNFKEAGYASIRNSTISAAPVFNGNMMYFLMRKKLVPALNLVKYDITEGKEILISEIGNLGDGSLFKTETGFAVVSLRHVVFIDTAGSVIKGEEFRAPVSAAPLWVEGKITAGLADGSLCQIDPDTKEIKYLFSPLNEDESTRATNRADSEQSAEISLNGAITAFAAYNGGFIVARFEGGLSLLSQKGEKIWETETKRISAPPVVFKNFCLVGDGGGTFNKIDLRSGEIKKRYETGGIINLPATALGDKVIVPVTDGRLILLDFNTFAPLQIIETEGRVKTPGKILNDKVIFGCDQSRLVIFKFD
ncbi:MAG: hypothetical protein B6D45_04395 [Ignavibacteriales bacterium UTCHB3]|nr:MAG: hypothetical protein B6D45_04395 [Ignavibacteriales bacterium UTCHB3]